MAAADPQALAAFLAIRRLIVFRRGRLAPAATIALAVLALAGLGSQLTALYALAENGELARMPRPVLAILIARILPGILWLVVETAIMPLTMRCGPAKDGVPAPLDGGSSLVDVAIAGFITPFMLANREASTPITLPEMPAGAAPASTMVDWRRSRVPRWLGGDRAGLIRWMLWSERWTLIAIWRWGTLIGAHRGWHDERG